MNDEQIQSFYDKYRDYLANQRDQAFANIKNSRRNAFQDIMSSANSAGMMYSNFPERSKYQYDTSTYYPAINSVQSSYQTGIDRLRSNMINKFNTIADLNDDIASLNKQSQKSSLPTGAVKLNSAGDYGSYSLMDGSQFYNSKGDKIRLGTALKRSGITGNQDILRAAEKVLQPEEFQRLKTIVDAQQNTKHPNLVYNVGDSYYEPNLGYLSGPDQALMKALGFDFGQ